MGFRFALCITLRARNPGTGSKLELNGDGAVLLGDTDQALLAVLGEASTFQRELLCLSRLARSSFLEGERHRDG